VKNIFLFIPHTRDKHQLFRTWVYFTYFLSYSSQRDAEHRTATASQYYLHFVTFTEKGKRTSVNQ